MRSTKKGIVSALESIGFKGMHIPIELVDENFYHLDTCFCVLGNDILWYPKAFGGTSKSMIRNLCVENHSIEVSDEDADNFVCNGIYFALRGRRYLITSPMSDKLRIRLEEIGIEVYENDISEFKKAGGGNKCLVFLF